MTFSDATSSSQWKAAVLAHAAHLNAYTARGDACGWNGMPEPNPAPDLQPLLPLLLERLHAAQGDEAAIAALRQQWPPLHEATQPLLQDNKQGIGALAWLPDGSLLVRTGMWYEPGGVVKISGLQTAALPGLEMFGLSPNRQVLALAASGRARLLASDSGALLAQFDLPKGDEGLPSGWFASESDCTGESEAQGATSIQQLIALDDASGLVVVQSTGVFLLTHSGIQRLLPTADELREYQKACEMPGPVCQDMGHAAVSPDGRWIACGSQDSLHCIFNMQGELIDCIGPYSEYPHHAAFFADGRHVAFNSCHFYHGCTIAVDVSAFGRIQTDFDADDSCVAEIDDEARVYASAPAGAALVLGDACGYLWARTPQGELLWKQHIGGTISALATSADGRWLAVGSCTGTVHIIDLNDTHPAPEQVGVRARREVRRWLFWKQQARPLAW